MQLAFIKLQEDLQQGIRRAYILHGDDAWMLLDAKDEVRAAAQQAGYSNRHILSLDHDAVHKILELASARDLLDQGHYLELESSHLPNAQQQRDLEQILQKNSTLLIIILPFITREKRTAMWLQTAQEHGGAVVECRLSSPEQGLAWLASYTQRKSIQITHKVLLHLLQQVAGDILAAKQALDRLPLLYPGEVITENQIATESVPLHMNVFQLPVLLWQALAKQIPFLFENLESIGVAPALVLWVLSNEIRLLMRLLQRASRGETLLTSLKAERVWGEHAKCITMHWPQWRQHALEQGLLYAAQIDAEIKGGPLSAPSSPSIWCNLYQLSTVLTQRKSSFL